MYKYLNYSLLTFNYMKPNTTNKINLLCRLNENELTNLFCQKFTPSYSLIFDLLGNETITNNQRKYILIDYLANNLNYYELKNI